MKLCDLFDSAGIGYPEQYSNIEISDIVTDSRRVTEGCLFICISGQRVDGHDHIQEAIDSGAAVIVAEKVRDGCVGGAAIVKVENTRQTASLLYNARYENISDKLNIIGITGTNGKTSISYMIESVFAQAGQKVGVIGTVEYRCGGIPTDKSSGDVLANMTTPDPEQLYKLLSEFRDDGAQRIVMEVSSHSLALHKVDAINFECSVFTNLTRDHLDFHKNMEDYFRAKSEILKKSKKCVVNIDDPYGKRLSLIAPQKCITCSVAQSADYLAHNIVSLGTDGFEYTLKCRHGDFPVKLSIMGDFAVMNSLEALATAIECGADPREAVDAIGKMPQVSGRMERVEHGDLIGATVLIDYAHTPDALEKALISVHGAKGKDNNSRIILVFGCGGERDRGKRRQMASIASRLSDLTVITSDNSRGEDPNIIFSDILKGIDKEKAYKVVPSRRDAIYFALDFAREGDFVLIAGKGHERYEIDSSGRHPFDEREIVRCAVENILNGKEKR